MKLQELRVQYMPVPDGDTWYDLDDFFGALAATWGLKHQASDYDPETSMRTVVFGQSSEFETEYIINALGMRVPAGGVPTTSLGINPGHEID